MIIREVLREAENGMYPDYFVHQIFTQDGDWIDAPVVEEGDDELE